MKGKLEMKTMLQLVRYSIITAAVFAAAFLATNKAEAYGSGDKFRINMEYSYGPNTPTSPPAPNPPRYWSDVGDWQIFLKTHGESLYLGSGYPNNNFDSNTETATMDWQTKNGLTPTGIVNQTTFNWSQLKNPTIITLTDLSDMVNVSADDGKDPFRIPLMLHDNPGGPCGAAPSDSWNDVFHWQVFLKFTFKDPNLADDDKYPDGTFDQNTQWATEDFQAFVHVTPKIAGQVDDPTYQAAVDYKDSAGKPAGMPAYPRVPHPVCKASQP